ncbi:MAG: class I SAM-dependent methyltransferase [Methylohalobius sp. ZOD2]
MISCCSHARAAEGLFSRLACCYRYRYRLLGLERSQRQLVEGLKDAGCRNARLLEIGCGVGFLHQTLLEQGADRAMGVDLSGSLLAEAGKLARRSGLGERVEYLQGDFLALEDAIGAFDIVILDKVICCYPDAQTLLVRAAGHAHRALALTYPRAILWNRMGMTVLNRLLGWMNSEFRTYLHDPADVERWLKESGWEKCHENQTLSWLTQVFVKP